VRQSLNWQAQIMVSTQATDSSNFQSCMTAEPAEHVSIPAHCMLSWPTGSVSASRVFKTFRHAATMSGYTVFVTLRSLEDWCGCMCCWHLALQLTTRDDFPSSCPLLYLTATCHGCPQDLGLTRLQAKNITVHLRYTAVGRGPACSARAPAQMRSRIELVPCAASR